MHARTHTHVCARNHTHARAQTQMYVDSHYFKETLLAAKVRGRYRDDMVALMTMLGTHRDHAEVVSSFIKREASHYLLSGVLYWFCVAWFGFII